MEGKVIQYARRDAVQYARRWALSRNRAYNDFTKGGGDCMNFVSQCLYAGGLPFKNNGFEWHGLRGGSSFSWRGVDSFLKLLKNYGEKHMTIPEAKRTARTIEWRQRRDPTFFASKVGAA